MKLNHQTGNIIYSKKAPTDPVNPSNQRVIAFENVGSGSAFAMYTSYKSTYWNSVALKFTESTEQVNLYKFYNYNNMTTNTYFVESVIDSTSYSFWIIRH